jgi:hypothetical protein
MPQLQSQLMEAGVGTREAEEYLVALHVQAAVSEKIIKD